MRSIKKLWVGDVPLVKTFWLNGLVLTAIFTVVHPAPTPTTAAS